MTALWRRSWVIERVHEEEGAPEIEVRLLINDVVRYVTGFGERSDVPGMTEDEDVLCHL